MNEYAVEVTSNKEKETIALPGSSKLAAALLAMQLFSKNRAEKIRVVHASSWSETTYKHCTIEEGRLSFKEKYS